MQYPFVYTVEDYAKASFEQRNQVDGWLESNGVIPQITKSFRIMSPTMLEVTQYEVTDGVIAQDEKWPHKPKLTKKMFKVSNNAFPTPSHT